jgi:hypothetical protein
MRFIACYKLVPEEQDIVITADRTTATDKAGKNQPLISTQLRPPFSSREKAMKWWP